ncbi:hypothetical protein CRV00_03975 [Malaciobacter molluscorum]|uniref:hypothetical protein n=1 Tax=Malaciobacter molluscorum TaxID=1032072 RepID=UPI00100C19A6|nr:hypothetical protein [Malaciobacter molluscorum]RXJ95607.1 hypothetical protein CRV00_03975 [Malaciobacter molluscorum]
MSMSQEEIESLMNGLDLDENENSEEVVMEEDSSSAETISNDDIDKLLAETNIEDDKEDVITSEEIELPKEEDVEIPKKEVEDMKEETSESTTIETNNNELDDILSDINDVDSNESKPVSNDDIDDLLKDIDNDDKSNESSTNEDEENFDDILSGISGITDSAPKSEPAKTVKEKNQVIDEEEELLSKIDSGIFPLPAENDTKVVNQLSQVANDSEEKASKIFDVLSYVLDDNNDIQKTIKNADEFLVKQNALLESLNKKFPNINIFNDHLSKANDIKKELNSINSKIEAENMQIFEAMELMQFHDINRQKIERVMAVIRKLSIYLNNLFEDEGSHQEIVVAKHIHGDNTADVLDDDDLESLIAEFGN